MAIESSIINYLLAQTSITSIVGTRIYPNAGASVTYPYITVTLQSDDPVYNLSGSAGFTTAHLEISLYSQLYSDTVTLSENIRTLLQGYQGAMQGTTVAATFLADQDDSPLPPPDASRNWVYHRTLNYTIQYYW